MPRIPILLLLVPLSLAASAFAADEIADAARSSRGSSALQGRPPPAVAAPPAQAVVHVDPSRALGRADAPLALVEFADFQCPYCRRFHRTLLPRLRAAFIDTGKVRYFYLDFPLPRHEHALGASLAARCAAAQGRYWAMVDALYAEQARLGHALYTALAGKLGLDRERFGQCLGAEAPERAVRRDLAQARRLGVRATPTFVLGRLDGERVLVERVAAGIPAFEAFAREIDALGR